MNRIAFSCGDTNGIGPEICIKTINSIYKDNISKIIVPIPKNILEFYLQNIEPLFEYSIVKKITNKILNENKVIFVLTKNTSFQAGKPTSDSGKSSIDSINLCLDYFDKELVDGIVTAPISKFAIQEAGIDFIGHTELIAAHYNINTPVMTFLSSEMKCALVTIHIPVKNISKELTKTKLKKIIEVIKNSMINDFKINSPKIAVLALNPHAGEDGKIGKEEIKIIKPIITEYFSEFAEGPFVPDAYYGNKLFNNFDLTLGMYHDQVLIPFKYIAFDRGVNFTAGLPIVRTSPDHGTAYNIAGKFEANANSMIEAFKWANIIINNRKTNVG
ncbi:MAG: 4-hydroxythreonine-4-phosphate dehydrogenase PdxA [bacterium]